MYILGLHHVTAITATAKENVQFYTQVLGLRLVKKTVNQDDVSAYHLFYADKKGTPGTDMTFFDWPKSGPTKGDTDGILRTMFRVGSKQALDYWEKRLSEYGISHGGLEKMGDKDVLRFLDPEGQRLALVNDEGMPFEAEVWDGGGVPEEYALHGFYAVQLVVPNILLLNGIFTLVLGFTKLKEYVSLDRSNERVVVYGIDAGGPGKEVHVTERSGEEIWAGAGGVHHVAFRVKDEAQLHAWLVALNQVRIGNSGLVERYYFTSLYFRVSDGILFELATDGPGFGADEPLEHLGENLALPPFLEPRRKEIEAGLKPL